MNANHPSLLQLDLVALPFSSNVDMSLSRGQVHQIDKVNGLDMRTLLALLSLMSREVVEKQIEITHNMQVMLSRGFNQIHHLHMLVMLATVTNSCVVIGLS